jgi:hypothetical protein
VDRRYVGSKGTDGFADLDINASDTPGGGNASRPFFSQGWPRARSLKTGARRLETEYHALQIADQPAIQERAAAQGRLHLLEGHEHGRRDRLGRALTVERRQPARSQLRAGRLRSPHVFQLGFVYGLPCGKDKSRAAAATSSRTGRSTGSSPPFSGAPFTDHRRRRRSSTCQATSRPPTRSAAFDRQQATSARTARGSTPPRSGSRKGRGRSATPVATRSAGLASGGADFSLFRGFTLGWQQEAGIPDGGVQPHQQHPVRRRHHGLTRGASPAAM